MSFYIKPQLVQHSPKSTLIVLYCLSTSNHNLRGTLAKNSEIVLYCLSTSNHNSAFSRVILLRIVLYCLSTSNHNFAQGYRIGFYIVLYCLSTSNHNYCPIESSTYLLSYIVFLHQTTTLGTAAASTNDCLILSFYIKPQPYLYILLIINQFYHI